MQEGQKVYRCEVSHLAAAVESYYMTEGVVTNVVLDGQQMVRVHRLLVPAEGWHVSPLVARLAVAEQLTTQIAKLQAAVDAIRKEVLLAAMAKDVA